MKNICLKIILLISLIGCKQSDHTRLIIPEDCNIAKEGVQIEEYLIGDFSLIRVPEAWDVKSKSIDGGKIHVISLRKDTVYATVVASKYDSTMIAKEFSYFFSNDTVRFENGIETYISNGPFDFNPMIRKFVEQTEKTHSIYDWVITNNIHFISFQLYEFENPSERDICEIKNILISIQFN